MFKAAKVICGKWEVNSEMTVSVLLWEKEYTVKQILSPRKILMTEPRGFFKGWGYISLYNLNQVIIQTLSISKNDTSSIVLPGCPILIEWITGNWAYIFQYLPSSAGQIMKTYFMPIYCSSGKGELNDKCFFCTVVRVKFKSILIKVSR